jgi:hypothetical protein
MSAMTPALSRRRRTKVEVAELDDVILRVLADDHPMTVRQVFYRLVVAGAVPKEENQGYGAVQRRLTVLRDTDAIPVDWIEDGVRRVRRPYVCLGLEEALLDTAAQYRRHLWANQPYLPVVVVEKLALAGVLESVTNPWDVPLVPVQGFSSISLIYELAQIILGARKPAYVHYFGDWDPSGEKIPQSFEERLRRYTRLPSTGISPVVFAREAILPWQIEEWSLPTRPTKREKNNHANGFVGDSVELDALPSSQLRDMVRNCIERHVDQVALATLRAAEDSERLILTRMAERNFAEIEAWVRPEPY